MLGNSKKIKKRAGAGFTIVELVTVIAIIVILATIIVINSMENIQTAKAAKDAEMMSYMHQLYVASTNDIASGITSPFCTYDVASVGKINDAVTKIGYTSLKCADSFGYSTESGGIFSAIINVKSNCSADDWYAYSCGLRDDPNQCWCVDSQGKAETTTGAPSPEKCLCP